MYKLAPNCVKLRHMVTTECKGNLLSNYLSNSICECKSQAKENCRNFKLQKNLILYRQNSKVIQPLYQLLLKIRKMWT